MKKIYISFLFLFILGNQLIAQNGTIAVAGARGAAMGNTGLAFSDINSIFRNQAGLAYLSGYASILSAEQRFLLSEISVLSAGAALSNKKWGAFGLSLGYFGFSDFNEQKIGLAYARKLFKTLAIGVQFDFLNTRIKEYGSKGVLTFEAGLHAKITKELHLAAHLFSPREIAITEEESIPTVFQLGLAYLPSTKITFTLEAEKDLNLALQIKSGLEYRPVESIALRVGAGTQPSIFSFGVGYLTKSGFRIDLAARYHQVLGITPSISISFVNEETPP